MASVAGIEKLVVTAARHLVQAMREGKPDQVALWSRRLQERVLKLERAMARRDKATPGLPERELRLVKGE